MSFPLLKCSCNSWKKLPNLIRTNAKLKLLHTPSSNKTIYKGKEAKKIRSFMLTRYVDYVKSYETVLESKFPAAMRVYRIFMVGIKEFYGDLKMFLKLAKKINLESGGMSSLSRKEMELYHQMPKDMIRVAPVLLISALPFANYVIFPLAYMFPRVMLCSHFWTLQQKSEFAVINLRNRLMHQRPVFRQMQERLPEISDGNLNEKWSTVLGLLGSGQQPSVRQVVECNKLFTETPYHIHELRGNHVKELLKLHALHSGWFRRIRLEDHARMIKQMDLAIIREGGVEKLTLDALKWCCFLRGINAANMTQTEMTLYLNDWLAISEIVDKTNLSLLLHSPILLGYNQPTNWKLIY